MSHRVQFFLRFRHLPRDNEATRVVVVVEQHRQQSVEGEEIPSWL